MARNDVRLVLTSEDGQAIQKAQKLLDEIRKTGQAYDEMGQKQKHSQDGFNESFGQTLLNLGKGLASMEAFSAVLDVVRDKMRAIADEQARVGQVSGSYSQAFSNLTAAMPVGTTQDQMKQMDAFLRQTAGSRALGDNGLIQLTDAATAIARAPISDAQRRDVLGETAQLKELQPSANATGLASGMAAMIAASGGTMDANTAQNMIMAMPGRIGDLGQRASLIGQLKPFADVSGREGGAMPMSEMMGLAGFVSEAIGDSDGQRTSMVIKRLWSKLMPDSSLTGSLTDRMSQMGDMSQFGIMGGEDEMAESLGLGRGPEAKLAVRKLMSPGGSQRLQELLGQTSGAGMLTNDLAALQIGKKVGALPGGEFMHEEELAASRLTSSRAGDVAGIRGQAMLEQMEGVYERAGKTEGFRSLFKEAFTALGGAGYASEEERAARAERIATEANALSKIPFVGGILASTAIGGAALEGATGTRVGHAVEGSHEIKRAISMGFDRASKRLPQRALPAGVER